MDVNHAVPQIVSGGGNDEKRQILVSEDRRELTIVSPRGHRAVYRSARPHGFTDADVGAARTVDFSTRIRGQVNRAREVQFGAWLVCAPVNTGPPTWWRPRIEVGPGAVSVGWLRLLGALTWQRSELRQRD